jgi:hypothetical protein
MPEGLAYDVPSGSPTLVARASWNGRVWPPGTWTPGMGSLYTPESSDGLKNESAP